MNEKSVASITGIVDGSGSAGAAIGQLVIAYLQTTLGWSAAFRAMALVVALSALPLIKMAWQETMELLNETETAARDQKQKK